MGNFFTKEIICDECTKQNIQPEYFEKQVICKTEDRDPVLGLYTFICKSI